MGKRFRHKSGTKVVSKDSQLEELGSQIDKLVTKKLTQMFNKNGRTLSNTSDEDFAFLDCSNMSRTTRRKDVVKANLPKTVKTPNIIRLEEKRLMIADDNEREKFDKVVQEFNIARTEEGRYRKISEERRKTILTRMGENEVYESDVVRLNINKSKNESINAEAVLKALVCNDKGQMQDNDDLKLGVQQIIDLARLGIVEIKKTDFDRWVKTNGYNSEPFLVRHTDKKRIIVAEKINNKNKSS